MYSTDFNNHLKLQHLLDSNGNIENDKAHLILKNEGLAVSVVKSMLGMILNVRGNSYILTNLELYYGSIGDLAHDWYRSQYPHKYSVKPKTSQKKASEQISGGPCIYLNKTGHSKYKRMDIVIGKDSVAVSVLVRNVADENKILLGHIDGQPNKILNLMGIKDFDHGKILTGDEDIVLLPRPDYLKFEDFQISVNLRFQNKKYSGFESVNDKKFWNFSISDIFIK